MKRASTVGSTRSHVLLSTGSLWLALAWGPPALAEGTPPQPSERILKRELIELSLSSVPIVRVSCTLTGYRGDDFRQLSESKIVQWDPESNLPLTRRLRVRGDARWGIQCGSEPLTLERATHLQPTPAAGIIPGVAAQPPSSVRSTLAPLTYSLFRAAGDGSSSPPLERMRGQTLLEVIPGKQSCHDDPDETHIHNCVLLALILEDATEPYSTNAPRENLPDAKAFPSLRVSIREMDKIPVSAGDDGSTIATNRSLIPFEQLAEDLATTVAEVAVDRAKTNATELIKDRLSETFCERLVLDNLRQLARGGPISSWIPADGDGALLPNTCRAVRGVRVSEMAASGLALRRALTLDLTTLAFTALTNLATSPFDEPTFVKRMDLARTMKVVSSMAVAMMTSRNEVTERQAQAMLLGLASADGFIGVASGTWRDLLLTGTAILTECLQQGECSADQLQRLLSEEEVVAAALEGWPDLPRMLVRMREVLRPAAGTPTDETVAKAMNIALDVIEYAVEQGIEHTADQREGNVIRKLSSAKAHLSTVEPRHWSELAKVASTLNPDGSDEKWKLKDACWKPLATIAQSWEVTLDNDECGALLQLAWEKDRVKRKREWNKDRINLLRSLVNASVDHKYGIAIQLAGSLLADLVRQECTEDKKCKVAITSASVEKWFGVLGAFSSYAASYNENPTEDSQGEQLSQYRAEQRKKAMNDLIDAATDRRGRGLDSVYSVGVFVGVATGQRYQRISGDCKRAAADCTSRSGAQEWSEGLSLQTGVSYELLPKGESWKRFGLHVQLTFLDLGRFLSASEGKRADAEVITPLYFGGQLGVLLGDPKYSALVAFDGGYAPGMHYGNESLSRGGFHAGLIAGMYVPFIDFN